MTPRIPLLTQLWHRIEAMPKPEAEDSISLRVLVQLLVIVGIVATDVAIAEPLNLWAIPVSIVGATWSYFRRRYRNVPVKFCIAIGMLVALAAFFGRLVGELNDTRLVLAQLLIHLQILHSFDVPRRKDLGYSMVIGLILLGVAATLSQTLTFAPVILLFLAIALPTLIFDYRSRLGLTQLNLNPTDQSKPSKLFSTLNVRFLALSFLSVVVLGLAIFALLPRFPSYQLRSFPVSSPIDLPQGQFDGTQVFNPGYVSQNDQENNSEGGSSGRSPRQGAGQLDSNFYYGFDTQINQNLRGQLTPKVVMRVRSQARGFWRVVAFDQYTGQGWEISRNDKDEMFMLNRPSWSYQFLLYPQITLSETREIVQSYTIISQLPNLLPAMPWAKEVYFPTQELAVDAERNLRSPLDLREGMTYTVISQVPFRNRSLLAEATNKYPQQIKDYYLEVPQEIREKVRQKTEEILQNINQVAQNKKPLDNPYEKALYLAQYLKQNPVYRLQEEPPFLREDEDLVSAFLFGYKDSPPGETITGGYPDHFATVLTMMLRSIGIPARLVAGFDGGEFNPFTGLYVVRNTDAHAMTEVYFPEYGWFAFNPIPGMELIPPSIEENQTFSALRAFWEWVAGWLPSPVTSILQTIFGTIFLWVARSIRWFLTLFAQGWLGLFTGLLVALIAGFLGWLGFDRWQVWRYRRWLSKLPAEESLYQQMLKLLATKGYPKSSAQTPLEYAHSLRSHHSIDEVEVIEEVSQTYVQWRYGGQSINLNQMRTLIKNLKNAHLKKLKTKRFSSNFLIKK
ncbi:transglutaminaseTgpA domain-containing protein [Limnoraphis robusta Tam1]|uniref:transglutaminase TgpA family protein n=1 Tax=Limnoraphis robusta TaxID=1118279 RepID=UPI002B215973|nr:transglutaminaseTgpA domain-containing protein [Limnoraphis robusta]MEA5538771.1 transglutaminaseTgpA domain-containing protein [Limnoraphis robusta Tam1]